MAHIEYNRNSCQSKAGEFQFRGQSVQKATSMCRQISRLLSQWFVGLIRQASDSRLQWMISEKVAK